MVALNDPVSPRHPASPVSDLQYKTHHVPSRKPVVDPDAFCVKSPVYIPAAKPSKKSSQPPDLEYLMSRETCRLLRQVDNLTSGTAFYQKEFENLNRDDAPVVTARSRSTSGGSKRSLGLDEKENASEYIQPLKPRKRVRSSIVVPSRPQPRPKSAPDDSQIPEKTATFVVTSSTPKPDDTQKEAKASETKEVEPQEIKPSADDVKVQNKSPKILNDDRPWRNNMKKSFESTKETSNLEANETKKDKVVDKPWRKNMNPDSSPAGPGVGEAKCSHASGTMAESDRQNVRQFMKIQKRKKLTEKKRQAAQSREKRQEVSTRLLKLDIKRKKALTANVSRVSQSQYETQTRRDFKKQVEANRLRSILTDLTEKMRAKYDVSGKGSDCASSPPQPVDVTLEYTEVEDSKSLRGSVERHEEGLLSLEKSFERKQLLPPSQKNSVVVDSHRTTNSENVIKTHTQQIRNYDATADRSDLDTVPVKQVPPPSSNFVRPLSAEDLPPNLQTAETPDTPEMLPDQFNFASTLQRKLESIEIKNDLSNAPLSEGPLSTTNTTRNSSKLHLSEGPLSSSDESFQVQSLKKKDKNTTARNNQEELLSSSVIIFYFLLSKGFP